MAKTQLLIIGGAEDKKEDCQILSRFAQMANQSRGNLVVLTTATKLPDQVGREYAAVFKKLGIENIEILKIENRDDAHNKDYVRQIKKAGSIFFTGGDQLRITSIIGGTPVCSALFRLFDKGAIIGGTSAGAAVMSETMIVEGNNDDSPRRCTVKMAPGLGFYNQVVIDTHFSQRGRHGRLLTAIAQNPDITGIGIDEDTGILVGEDGNFQVLGSRTVLVVDGREISHSNVSEQAPDEVLALADVRLHVLPQGYGYDLKNHHVLHRKKEAKE